MRFAAPQWLWALLLLPILYGYVVWELRRRRQMYARFADSAVWRVIAPELHWQARLRKGVVWLLALGMMILALARPQWGTHEESVKLNGLDLVVALDVSNSMYVEDFVPSRLKKAKHAIRNLVAQLKGDRVGLVIFAGSAYLASPLTTDIEYFLEVLETASPEAISNQGTDIGLALDTSARALERAAEDRSGAKPSEGGAAGGPATKVVLLISDGEDLEEGIGAGIEAVKKAGARFFAMGIGTEKGGPVPIRDDSGILVGFKKDEKRQPVVSRFRPAALASLTQQLAGRYWDISPNEGEVDEFLQEIGALERGEFSERTYLVYENRYQIPLFFAVLLLLLELSFRAHRRVALGFLLFLLAAGAAPAQAAPGLGVYLENE
ncbi:MAG: VWA domain-containing protein, partial [Bacteriovoracia bacterium]